jgi:hypothetical protein
MPDQRETKDDLSPQDLRRWLSEELSDLAKAFQLRAIEASALVNEYASGEISAKEAEERLERYDRRWGEALPGASASSGLSDKEIVAAVDKAAAQQNAGIFQKRFVTRPEKSGPQEPSR